MDKASVADLARDTWMDILESPVSDDTNYFEIGGHSFQALQIIARMDSALGARIPLRVLFDSPRFGDFVDQVAAHLGIG